MNSLLPVLTENAWPNRLIKQFGIKELPASDYSSAASR